LIFKNQQSDEASSQGELFKKGKRSMSGAERVSQLQEKLYCKAKQDRKSQRRSRLYGQQAFEMLVHKYGLIDPTKYSV